MRTLEEIKSNWEITELNALNYKTMKEQFLIDLPRFIGTDTETDGLNYLKSKPFDFIFGWMTKDVKKVFIWMGTDAPNAIEDYKEIIKHECYRHHFAWNAIFDANMLLNIGVDIQDRLADGQALLRLISPSDFSFERKALKKVSTKYLAEDAATYEIELKNYLKNLKNEWRKNNKNIEKLIDRKEILEKLIGKDFNNPDEYNEVRDELREVREQLKILQLTPEPNYTNIPKDLLHKYAALDVILMMELIELFYPKVMNPKSPLFQKNIFEEECRILPAVIQQVRTGWRVDMDYLEKSMKIVENAIKNGRKEMVQCLGEEINPGQNKELAMWFERNGWEYPVETRMLRNKMVTERMYKADKGILDEIIDSWKNNPEKKDAVRVCELLIQLRTLEKWHSTYLLQIKENVEAYGDGAFHPSYDPYGAVSGRFTSNSQQFPRGAIYDENKNELFYPRKLMIPPEGTKLWYFDYSQIELRLAAEWTIKAGLPDPVLVNAYMNYDNDPNWAPTDMHLEMAKNAFSLTEEQINTYLKGEAEGHHLSEAEMKLYKYTKNCRTLSKIANFASLYGGKRRAINDGCFQGKDLNKAIEIERAFGKTFPGVINYQQYIAHEIKLYKEVKNSMGRIYWFKDGDFSAQKTAGNYVIQGTGADFLKERMAAVWDFMKENNLKTKMVGNIHDEIQFAIPYEEEWIVPKIKEIMATTNGRFIIPLLADVEVATTNWAEKETVHYE